MLDLKARQGVVEHAETDNCTGLDNQDEPLKCVFSTVLTIKIGTGATARKQRSKALWYVKQKTEDSFGVRKLNPQFVPAGEETDIDRETLLSDYTPEVQIHNKRVVPAMQGVSKAIAKGDKHREKGESFSAEMEYNKVLDVDLTNVRAIFGLGLVYMARSDTEKSLAVFEQLVTLEAAFDIEHKHLFNEFGIQLRKHKLYDQAGQYYRRAVELADEDENLYYNLARVHYENDDWDGCFSNAALALALDSSHKHAASLCDIILALSADVSLCEKYGKSAVPESVAQRAVALSKEMGLDRNRDAFKLDLAQAGEVSKL
jgi:tetratricopeptide (TPR) repeat protein